MKEYLYLLVISILASSMISAQDSGLQRSGEATSSIRKSFDQVPETVLQPLDHFFETLISGNVEDAYDDLLKNSPLGKKDEDVEQLISQTKRSATIYGKLKGYEPVNVEIVGSSYMRIRYLGLNEQYPMRWIFTYYKSPNRKWAVTNIKFDDLSEYFFTDQ